MNIITKEQYDAYQTITSRLEDMAYSFLNKLCKVLPYAKCLHLKYVRIAEKGYHEQSAEYIHIELEEDYHQSGVESYSVFLPMDALFAEDGGEQIIDDTILYLMNMEALRVIKKDLKDKEEKRNKDLKELARLKQEYPDA